MSNEAPRLNVGVIGLGTIAQTAHLPALQSLPDLFEIVHLCDTSPGVLAAVSESVAGSPRTSESARAVLADDDVEVVLLLTPGAHGALTIEALEAGKHVLSEKPLCVSQSELSAIRRLSERMRLVVQVGYMKCHEAIVPEARAALARLGSPTLVRTTVLHPSEESQLSDVSLIRATEPDSVDVVAAKRYESDRIDRVLGASTPEWVKRLYIDWALGSLVHQHALIRAVVDQAFQNVQSARSWRTSDSMTEPAHVQSMGTLGDGCAFDLTWLWTPDHQDYVETLEIVAGSGVVSLVLPPPYDPGGRAALTVTDGATRRTKGDSAPQAWAFRRQLVSVHSDITAGRTSGAHLDGVRDDLTALQTLVAAIAGQAGVSIRIHDPAD